MRVVSINLLVIGATLLAILPLTTGAGAALHRDPMVLLDEAKLVLGEGRLEDAEELLAQVPTINAEPEVIEEVLVQRLLINSAGLSAVHYLLAGLKDLELADSAYGEWLIAERERYCQAYIHHCTELLTRCAGGFSLEFIRFRLPEVSTDHLRDTEVYMDTAFLNAACTNWTEGREALGRGLVASQARVAVVLGAASFYDLPQAAPDLGHVNARLAAGVPLDEVALLAWLSQISSQHALPGDGLAELARQLDRRLLQLDSGYEPGTERANVLAPDEQNTNPDPASERI